MSAPSGDGVGGDVGYDGWLSALADGEGFALRCANGHRSLPPRRLCPECSSDVLERSPLPSSGTIATFSEVHIPTPAFAQDAPYVLAIVDFGGVRLTGQLRNVNADDVAIGDRVGVSVGERRTTGDPIVTFTPA